MSKQGITSRTCERQTFSADPFFLPHGIRHAHSGKTKHKTIKDG
jgi:hypothetical protein